MPFINQASREISLQDRLLRPRPGREDHQRPAPPRPHPRGGEGAARLAQDGERSHALLRLLPLEIGSIGGFRTRLQLYTVPGQVFYRASRRLILRGLDGVVFVADSQVDRLDANVESMADLGDNLDDYGRSLSQVPLVIQYNKRDLDRIAPLPELRALLNPGGAPELEAAAASGRGVFETLKAVSRLVLLELKRRRP